MGRGRRSLWGRRYFNRKFIPSSQETNIRIGRHYLASCGVNGYFFILPNKPSLSATSMAFPNKQWIQANEGRALEGRGRI
jgi:hypothetical protein